MRQILWVTSIIVTLFSAITYGETLSYIDLIGQTDGPGTAGCASRSR